MNRIKTDVSSKILADKEKSKFTQPVKGFVDFVSKYSIIGMAIGIIIGQTTKDTVNALVTGIITPAIQLLLPNTDLQGLVIKVNKAEFQVGLLINAIIEMLLIMAILYFTVGVLLKRSDLLDKSRSRKKTV